MDENAFAIALKWLADAPLFMDDDQVDRFHDAVIAPLDRIASTHIELSTETAKTIAAELEAQAKAGLSVAGLLSLAEAKLGIKATGELGRTTGKTRSIAFEPIRSSQRQLVQLTWHYQDKYKERAFYVTNPSDGDWRDVASIKNVPRSLVFLDLPGEVEANGEGVPSLKLIPAAAEFSNGKIIPLYQGLLAKNGEAPPKYPERDADGKTAAELRKQYWSWFDTNFRPIAAMLLVEKAASENGRIQWIDYRLPITKEGDTLHLHIVPHGRWDTGVFAYNFIKRGFKHGLRLVGTLKSEPDMNVIAIYDK